jgi:glycosyltransferase involved in cell wall biosynthesis
MKSKILFILHLPPPVHGSAVVGQYIKDSKVVDNAFDTRFINLSTSLTIDEIGKKPIRKIIRYFKILSKVIVSLIFYNPKVVYISITSKGPGFYKDFPVALFAKLFRKKLVLHYHNKGVSNYQHRLLDNWLYKILFKNSKIILLSENLYKDISKYVLKENVFICPNGIPVPNGAEEVLPKNNKVPRLLFLSNLIESKGVYVLLEALKLLKDKKVQFHCNFVGGEGDISTKQLGERISNLNLNEHVTYLGKKYADCKYDILKSSYCLIFPTFYHNECFPLVLLEAMMFKLPVISTDEGGISDIVKDGETGFIVEKQKPKQLAEKIKWFIENPEKAILVGKKGQEMFFKHYKLEVFEKRMTHILNQI